MKGTEQFKIVIQNHLNDLASSDQLFAETLKKTNKNIDDCISHIFNQVKSSGCNGFADEEIYQMATHYYDEDDIKVGKPINGTVVVNHQVELSEEEKKSAKQRAYEMAVQDERKKVKLKNKVELSKEEITEAKRLAISKLVDEQKDKLVKKKAEKSKPKEENITANTNNQTSLF